MLYLRYDRYILLKNVMFLSIEIYYDILKFFFYMQGSYTN